MEIKKKWRFHLILFIVIIAMGLFNDYVYRGARGFKSNFIYPNNLRILLLYISFYFVYFLNYYYVCPKTLIQKKFFKFILGIFALYIVFAITRYILEEIVFSYVPDLQGLLEKRLRNFGYYATYGFSYALRGIIYSTLLFLMFQYIDNKNKIGQLQLEHKKAELSFLKSQISPHFLFNILNTFYGELIDKEPNTAKDIHKLSELLRYVTYNSSQDFMPLKKEIQFIEDYIYFFRKRFEKELHVNFKIEGKIANQKVPSLIFIHFIENLFKHGAVNEKEYPAEIDIKIVDKFIILKTRNKILSSEKYMDSGIGSENVKRRLKTLFSTNFELTYSQKDSYFETLMKIPL